MTTKQHPIGSGFPAASTAADVVAGIDMSGKNVIVTGGHAGLGLETTRTLSRAGAAVTVAARDLGRARPALAGLDRVEVGQLDLVDPNSIEAFAARWLASGRPLHVLVNCAGASGGPSHDARGYETQFARRPPLASAEANRIRAVADVGVLLADRPADTRSCPRGP